MRFHAFEQSPVQSTEIIFRASWASLALGSLICLLFLVMGVAMLWTKGAPTLFGLCFGGGGGLCSLLLLRNLIRAWRGDVWGLRYDPQLRRMLIRLADTMEPSSPQTQVLGLDTREIEWVRHFSQTTISRPHSSSSTCLEIKLRETNDLEELRRQLTTARAPRKHWGGFESWPEIPVSISTEGLIRVEWYGRRNWLTPSLKKALARLAADGFEVKPKHSEVNDFTVPTVDNAKMEQQILEFAEKGRMIEAIKLAQKRYRYSLADAKQFVEQLRGDGKM
jgi:hypothetical protein